MADSKTLPPAAAQLSDRAYMASQLFADFVHDHPFAASRPNLAALVEEIEGRLADLIEAIHDVESVD